MEPSTPAKATAVQAAVSTSPSSNPEGRTRRIRAGPSSPSPSKATAKLSQEHEAPMASPALSSHLAAMFPGRAAEIKLLLALLGQPDQPLPPLFIYGGPSTGKTILLLEVFYYLKRPFAYASCRSCHNARILFESILNQLFGHVRSTSNNFGSAKKCDKLLDFVAYLPNACTSAISLKSKSSRAHSKKSSSEDTSCEKQSHEDIMLSTCQTVCQPVVYLIIDNIELLLDWPDGLKLFAGLVKLPEFTGLPNLGIIFISALGLDVFYSGTGMLQPLPIYFRGYNDEELHQILLRRKPQTDLYSSFLSAVLKTFSRVTRHVTELAEALEPLFQKYLEPIRRGIVKPDEHGKRKLFAMIQPHIAVALQQTCGVVDSTTPLQGILPSNQPDLKFQLSLCSKYLLISAFICSRNPATLDAAFFDSSGGGSKKRRRRSSQIHMEKKELQAQEKALKGPGTFPLERLLAIFSCISVDVVEDMEGLEADRDAEHGLDVSSDVLMQVSTLVNDNLLYKGSSDPLDGAPRYRCNANEELVQVVARSINFPLSRYLYRI